jgi:hypothetical protein
MHSVSVRLEPSDQLDPSNDHNIILWRSVIRQTLADATDRWPVGSPTRIDAETTQRQARAWLTGLGPDFREVCSLANLDPHAVCEAAIDFITETDRRRAAGLKHKRMGVQVHRKPSIQAAATYG